MKVSNTRFGVLGGLAATLVLSFGVAALYACGSTSAWNGDGGTGASSGGTGGGGGGGGGGGAPQTTCDDAGKNCSTIFVSPDGSTVSGPDASAVPPPQSVMGTTNAPDCMGCTFPPTNAPACASSAPAIKVVYPPDTVLVPPNLNVISVQWTPFGPPFARYEVDFSQTMGSATTDWRIVTACATQTQDMQPCVGNCTNNASVPSGGCEVTVDPISWSKLVQANRGGTNPIQITVRGSTDGNCASTSTNTIHMSIAEQDLVGTYYYWKSTIGTGTPQVGGGAAMGIGGQIWAQNFGNINPNGAGTENDVTSNIAIQGGTLNATCNGCHVLSRDGSRMVVYSDDADSDDEYSDVGGSLLDMTPLATNMAAKQVGNNNVNMSRSGGQPPGFTTINPTANYYVSSNGFPCTGAAGGRGGGGCGTSAGYPAAVPSNGWSEWNGQTGAFVGPVTIGPTQFRPTMPDWSIDGKTVLYVQPNSVAQYDVGGQFGTRNDDMHMFGGSLYTVPYTGNGAFGTPAVYLQSSGENNYYPSYSPDNPMSFIIFDRAPMDNSAGSLTGCTTGTSPTCPNDSFSNPAARLMLMGANAAGSTPIDLERANGSSANVAVPMSNSYPRWAPFVQQYHGNKILWFTFSSTRDYGVRVLNNKMGMYQCYPADAYQTPGGAHNLPFSPQCKQPQLWMAPLTFTEAQSASVDPSGVAFWVPYQDILTHNHTAQWTQEVPVNNPDGGTCTCGMLYGACGPANGGCPCCAGMGLACSGNGQCIQVPN